MKGKFLISGILVFLLLIFAGVVSAKNDSKGKTSFSLPANASEVAPGVFLLGKAQDVDGRLVEGYAYVHHKDAGAKPIKPPKGGGTTCYGYLASGAKWKVNETWVVNPENSRGLGDNFVLDTLQADIGKWESAATKNILGDGNKTSESLEADTTSPDSVNEIYFADITDSNAIAVTIVWGYFSGPPTARQLVEWDQVYDDVTFDWSSSAELGKMDFDNIATHEIGHSFGMDDMYQLACSEVTMYGYADFGETIKRTLAQPDIDGVKALYR